MAEQKLAEYSEVSQYYDKLWAQLDQQKLSGINSRHRFFLKYLKAAGLKRNSRVLEIGCGNGTLTAFVARHIPSGKITGVDISPETIEMAKHRYLKSIKNIEFKVSNMTNFRDQEKFDFVIFPDVLEHIPLEAHNNIFKTIRENVHQDSTVLINIPYPRASEFMTKHHPEHMQIIDQALHTDTFIKAIYDNDFYLEQLKSYTVFFKEPDYQLLLVRPNKTLTKMQSKSKLSILTRSLLLRIENLFT